MPLLALLALVFRVLLPAAFLPGHAADAAPALHDHGHSGHHAPAAGAGGDRSRDGAGLEHQACHFCRFQDPSLPPPAVRQVARTVPPARVEWPAQTLHSRAGGDFLVVVRARAPPSGPV